MLDGLQDAFLGDKKDFDASEFKTHAAVERDRFGLQKDGKFDEFEFQTNAAVERERLGVQNSVEFDDSEFGTNATVERERLGLQNEVKFASKDHVEREDIREANTEELHTTEDKPEEMTSAMNFDQAFWDQLTSKCEQKAADWNRRSKTHADEFKTQLLNVCNVSFPGFAPWSN